MRVQLLGPVQIYIGDDVVEVGPRQRCLVFAALAVDAGSLVSRDRLIERVWGLAPPHRAWRTAQTHIASLRGLLRGADPSGSVALVRRRGGYVLDIEPDLVDIHRFRRLAVQAASAKLTVTERVTRWREAVGLWRGEPLAALGGDWVQWTRDAWYGENREAVLGWAYAEIQAGDPTTVIESLRDLIRRYPLVEALPAMLMRALYANGRRIDALDFYAAARTRLDQELAERPGPELQAVYQAILRRDPDLPPPVHALPAGSAVPAQLPADVRGFAGRAEHLAELDVIAATISKGDGGDEATAVVISAIAGTAGVGKTALAVHWAYRAAHRFPDGQLYINLRGFDPAGTIVDPAEAIRGFLDALGMAPQRIPANRDARASLYRTLLANKRMLIVLDNARDSTQVRPLLPGAPGCLVLVTSRNRLTSLVAATGAHPLPLDLLTPAEARDLLSHRVGHRRVAAESDAVDALITRCARLPLALAVVAARAATHPHLPLAALATELHDSRTRLYALAGDDPATDLIAVFSWSYTALTPPAQRVFRLLGLHPGPDISTSAAASLAALPPSQARPLLAELAAANLIVEHRPGRYSFHDLLCAYAAEQADHTDPAEERHATTRRLLDHYLHTAHDAARLLQPHRDEIPVAPPAPGAEPQPLDNQQHALAWLAAELPVLLATVEHAAAHGYDTHVCQLAWSLTTYLYRCGRWHDEAAVQLAALAAAQRLGDPAEEARFHRLLSQVCIRQGRLDDAGVHLRQALDASVRSGDIARQGHAEVHLAVLAERLGRYDLALDHGRNALDLYRRADYRHGQADALNQIGWFSAHLGDNDQAYGACREALEIFQEMGSEFGAADTWDSLGFIQHRRGEYADAVHCFEQAVQLYRGFADRYGEADSLSRLGETMQSAGDNAGAHRVWREALAILEEIEHPDAEAIRAKIERHNLSASPISPRM